MISYFDKKEVTVEDFLKTLTALELPKKPPFNTDVINVLTQLSEACLKSDISVQAPQLVALGFWLRPAHLSNMKKKFEQALSAGNIKTTEIMAVPRGLAFHLPPANVDTLFIYSWALSLLAGNANVTRLPSNINPVGEWVLKTLHRILSPTSLGKTNLFINYGLGGTINQNISALSDLRLIWGGDEKVKMISQYPVRLDGISLGFPNRKSFCIIEMGYYAALSETEKSNLCEKFYNDTFWFDQLGCGSPRAIIWYDQNNRQDQSELIADFYTQLLAVIKRKGYTAETAVAISKFGFLNEVVAQDKSANATKHNNELSTIKRDKLDKTLLDDFHGGGIISEAICNSLDEIGVLFNRSTQTLTHAGFSLDDLKTLANLRNGPGGYRFVPIGKALNFDNIWDGLDLLKYMTRKTVLELR